MYIHLTVDFKVALKIYNVKLLGSSEKLCFHVFFKAIHTYKNIL